MTKNNNQYLQILLLVKETKNKFQLGEITEADAKAIFKNLTNDFEELKKTEETEIADNFYKMLFN